MKLKNFALILLLLAISCTNNDDSTPITKANISGSVNLYDEATTPLDKSNMLVKVNGTVPLISALTDSNGEFVLKDVPFGTYTIEYEKLQYGIFKKFNFNHQGNTNIITETPSLGKISSTQVTDLQVSVTGNQILFFITTNTNSTVSNSNFIYHSPIFVSQINPYQSTITQNDLITAGFVSGQTVYVKAYGESYWSNEYFDVNLNKKVFPNLNALSANAVSFIVP